MNRFTSVAEWDPKHGFQDNRTTDRHQSRAQAVAVCRMLELHGLGGERCHFPVRTWVEEDP